MRSFSTFEEIGFYAAANKIVAVLLIQAGFSTFWTPVAFEKYEDSPEDTNLYSKLSKALAGKMLATSLILISLKDIIVRILDSAYLLAANIMLFYISSNNVYSL